MKNQNISEINIKNRFRKFTVYIILAIVSIFTYINLSWANSKNTGEFISGNVSHPELKNWSILFITNGTFRIYHLKSDTFKTIPFHSKNILISACLSANYTTRTLHCTSQKPRQSLLLNFETLKIIRNNIPFSDGVISSDGKYVISKFGDGVYEIETKKYYTAYDKYIKSNRLYTSECTQSKKVCSDNYSNGLSFPTKVKPNGDFLAIITSESGEIMSNTPYYKFNLLDIVKNKGKGFNLKKTKHLDDAHYRNYIGNEMYLCGFRNIGKSIAEAEILSKNKSLLQCRSSHHSISNDGKFAFNSYVNSSGKIVYLILNLDSKKYTIPKNLNKYLSKTKHHSHNGAKFWLWLGDPKKNPAYIDY